MAKLTDAEIAEYVKLEDIAYDAWYELTPAQLERYRELGARWEEQQERYREYTDEAYDGDEDFRDYDED